MSRERLNLCRIAVSTLPSTIRNYYATRFRRGCFEYHKPHEDDAALEIYRYAFYNEKPPRRYRKILRPILTSLRLSEE